MRAVWGACYEGEHRRLTDKCLGACVSVICRKASTCDDDATSRRDPSDESLFFLVDELLTTAVPRRLSYNPHGLF